MRRFTNSLDHVAVATPCPADWDGMFGTERVRFCGQCELNVYNLSAMSKRDAESLIARTEGRLCVRFYRRRDGSIITQDCPVGLRALKRRATRIKRAVASSLLGFLAGIGMNAAAVRFQDLVSSTPAQWGNYGHTVGVMAVPRTPQPVKAEPDGSTNRIRSTKPREAAPNRRV